MAGEETIGRATIELGADGSKLGPEMAAAMAKAQGELTRANKQMEKAQASTFKAIQGHIDRINATRPTNEMRMLEQAVLKLGGSSKLSGDQLKRVTAEVNALAAAGAKVPASLAGLTGIGSKLGAAFTSLTTGGGISGAVSAIGPAAIAAAGAFGVVTLAVGAAGRAMAGLAADAEGWSNTAEATGLGVESVQKLQDYLTDAGFSAEDLGTMMKKLQVEVATGGKAFEKYGISLAQIKDLAPEEQLRAVAQAVTSIIDPTERAAAAQEFFGKQGAAHLSALSGIAQGAYKDLAALTSEQVSELKRVDDQLDQAARSWKNWEKTALTAAAKVVNFLSKPVMIGGGEVRAGGVGGLAGGFSELNRISNPATYLDSTSLTLGPQEEETKRRAAEASSAAQKAADELLATRRKYNELQVAIVKGTRDEADTLRDLDEMSKSLLAKQESISKGQLSAQKETRLRGGDMLPSVGGAGLWTKYQDVLDQEMENAAAATKKVAAETKSWESTLGSLADNLNVLAQTTGGLTGKIVGFAASLASGLGGAIQGFKTMQSSGGGLMGTLGKVSGALGMVGSIVGVAGSLFKGIKSLFGGKSKEQKAAEAAAKKQAADEAKAVQVETAQKKLAAGEQAKGFAESLSAKLAAGGLSEKLTAALQGFVGRMGEALGKLGLGIVDARLKDSESFQAASGVAGDVAGALGAASQAGIADVGLTAAASGAAAAIQEQAITAAREAGLSDMEAAKQGSLAIAAILKEQLNASIRSGQELDANTAALIEEAKKNGINILADPAIESLGVQKEMLGTLQQIAGQGGGGSTKRGSEGDVPAADGFGPMITPNLGGGLGPRIQTHPGELAMVIPRSKMGPGGLLSAAAGLYSRRSGGGSRGRGVSTTSINLTIAENPFQSAEGAARLRSHTLKTVERQTSKHLAALIAAGRA